MRMDRARVLFILLFETNQLDTIIKLIKSGKY